MKNKLVAIGYMGCKSVYLNIDKEEAIKRYCASEDIIVEQFEEPIREFEFEDEFGAYDVIINTKTGKTEYKGEKI
jgi:hypothetical protein